MTTRSNHGGRIPLPERDEMPSWVIDEAVRQGGLEHGCGYILVRDGVIIDRWYPRRLR